MFITQTIAIRSYGLHLYNIYWFEEILRFVFALYNLIILSPPPSSYCACPVGKSGFLSPTYISQFKPSSSKELSIPSSFSIPLQPKPLPTANQCIKSQYQYDFLLLIIFIGNRMTGVESSTRAQRAPLPPPPLH